MSPPKRIRTHRCPWCNKLVDKPPAWIRSPLTACSYAHDVKRRQLDATERQIQRLFVRRAELLAERLRVREFPEVGR